MNSYETIHGTASVTNVWMERGDGYGQYKVITEFGINGHTYTAKANFTDSHTWDKWSDIEDANEGMSFMLDHAASIIEKSIKDKAESIEVEKEL